MKCISRWNVCIIIFCRTNVVITNVVITNVGRTNVGRTNVDEQILLNKC